MELRTLRYFLAVASERNITKAAEMLHLTQPTLSRQLSELEDELGTQLVVRGKRALTLTEDGRLFKQRAEDIVEMIDRTEHEFAARSSAVSGIITLGMVESVNSLTLAKFISEFSTQYPDVSFNLYNGMADTLKDSVDQGRVDLALVLEPVDTTKYEFMRLAKREMWGALVRHDHPFAGREYVDVGELRDQPLMLPSRASSRTEIINWLGCDERQLNIPVSYNILSNTALLVEAGVGVAICLEGALSIHHSSDLRFVPLKPERFLRGVLIWKKDRVFNLATSMFVQMLHRYRDGDI